MHYLTNLYNTYNALEKCGEVGNGNGDKGILLPIYHTSVKAQVDVSIDMNGNFVSACVVPEDDRLTIIPATNASESRASGLSPHPLFDKLIYVAGDYCSYAKTQPKETGYEKYMSNLREWCESEFSNTLIKAVYKYLSKRELVHDLVAANVFFTDSEGHLLNKWNNNGDKPPIFQTGISQSDCFIRFTVLQPGIAECGLYLNETVRNDYINYHLSQEGQEDVCYISGKKSVSSRLCPGKVRNAGDRAKIICTNDDSGFTYRGRLTEGFQVYAISEEVAYKAFSALRYLIARQGYRNDTLAILTWATSGIVTPAIIALGDASDIFSELGDEDAVPPTREEFAKMFNKYVSGYKAKLGDADGISVIALNSTSGFQGRLSVTYYRELKGSEYFERIEKWHNDTAWTQARKIDKDWISFYGAPAPKTIAQAVYGTAAKPGIVNECIARILPCIIDGACLPQDIVRGAIINASRRTAFENWEWERNLSVACALYNNQHKEENYSMSLERERNSRDYLFGRLLAVADVLETRALCISGEKRDTNAAKFMQRFADSPYETWCNLETKQLSPYKSRLGHEAAWLINEIQEIMNMFVTDDFMNNRPLKGEYLLGYYCERAYLNQKREKQDQTDETENSNN